MRMTDQVYCDMLYQRTAQLLSLFAQNVQSSLNDVKDASFTVLADNIIQENITKLTRLTKNSEEWREIHKETSKRLSNLVYMQENLSYTCLYMLDGTSFTISLTSEVLPTSLLTENMQRVWEAKGSAIFLIDENDAQSDLYLLRAVREVADFSFNSIAMIAMQVNMDSMVDKCLRSLDKMDMPMICCIDFDGKRVYSSNDHADKVAVHSDGFSLQSIDGETFFCVSAKEPNSSWCYTAALPYSNVIKSIKRSTTLSLVINLTAFTIAMLLASWLISSILNHFKRLIKKYNVFERGETQDIQEIAMYQNRRDEIGELHRQFDQMAAEHKRMIDEIYIKQQLLLEAQLLRLRAQIQPHFLYNTLESISCLAAHCGDPRISIMSTALGRMLRATLNDKRDIITLREDIAIAQEYLNIQSIRYSDQLKTEFCVDEALGDTPIPAISLQPLVENAIRHGAEQMLDLCMIRVSAQRKGCYVDITVEDNGPGMDEDTLEKLERGEIQPEGLGIGLCNINQRLKLAFQDEACGLRIQRIDGRTQVIMRTVYGGNQ